MGKAYSQTNALVLLSKWLVLELFENYTSELKFANDFIIRFRNACFECGYNKKGQSEKLLLAT